MVPETTSASGVRAAAAFAIGKHGGGVPGGRAASAEAQIFRRSWAGPAERQGTLLTHGHSCASPKPNVTDAGKENFPVV
jgi:hypothetical protein